MLRALLVTDDPDILDDVLRLATAAGAEVDVATSAADVRRRWLDAPAVYAGADAMPALLRAGLTRRGSVVVVARDAADGDVLWRQAVGLGAEHVAVLGIADDWLLDHLVGTTDGASSAPVLGVVGGRGGSGATLLAAALATTAARRPLQTVLLDADPLGGGIDLALGAEHVAGLRWPALAGTRGRVTGASLTAALPVVDGLHVLSWDRGDLTSVGAEPMEALLAACVRSAGLVVVDLPRHADAAARAALGRCTTVLMVLPAEVRACASGARVAASVADACPDVRLVVRGPSPGGLDAVAVSAAVGLPLAGVMKPDGSLAARAERGSVAGARGPLARFARTWLDGWLPPVTSVRSSSARAA